MEFISLFIFIAGYIIGLGAVTVIDLQGFLARRSEYWTEATIRSHKVTKPLIWIGIFLVVVGWFLFFKEKGGVVPLTMITAFGILILNGIFLSFVVSPYLLKREKEGLGREILSSRFQKKITISFIISVIGWWGSLALLVYYIVM